MSDHLADVVRRAVAKHLGIDRDEIEAFDHLQRDLHLQPLDIVLVVLAIEDSQRIALPIANLDSIATVTGLTTLVRRAYASARHAYVPRFVPMYRRVRRARRLVRRVQEV
jgi:acyl carrier protein